MLRLAKYSEESGRHKKTCCHLDSSEVLPTKSGVKKSQLIIIIIIIIITKLKFDHTNKWYMHNPASVLENETHKLLWDFDIQTDHFISARRPDLIIINEKERELAKWWTLLSRLTTE